MENVIVGLIGIIAIICTVGVIVGIRSATRQTATWMRIISGQVSLALHHMGIDETAGQPPCRRCKKKGTVVQLVRDQRGELACPTCGGVRKLA